LEGSERFAVTLTCPRSTRTKKTKSNRLDFWRNPKENRREKKKKTADINSSRARRLKDKIQKEYSELHIEVKKYIKEDKYKYIEAIASEAEEEAFRRNMRDLYSNIRKLAEKFGRPAPQNITDIKPTDIDLQIECGPPNKEEIFKAIQSSKYGKVSGPDNIQAEAFKVDMELSGLMLHKLFGKMWEEE
jgi:hypothetical protein